jgi:hypothetical protein
MVWDFGLLNRLQLRPGHLGYDISAVSLMNSNVWKESSISVSRVELCRASWDVGQLYAKGNQRKRGRSEDLISRKA